MNEGLRFIDSAETPGFTKLVVLLQDAHSDAMNGEQRRTSRLETRAYEHPKGALYQRMPIDAPDHALIRGSVRLVMKPPHPKDTTGLFTEVFVLPVQDDVIPETPEHFLLRSFVDGSAGPFWFVDANGVHPDDVTQLTQEQVAQDPLAALERAEEFYEMLADYSVVPSSTPDA